MVKSHAIWLWKNLFIFIIIYMGSYRENVIGEPFDPLIHVNLSKKEGGGYVRKSAKQLFEKATEEASLRNEEDLKGKSWYKKLFFKKHKGLDILHGKALEEHVHGLIIYDLVNDQRYSRLMIKGKFNNIEVILYEDKYSSNDEKNMVDGEEITDSDAHLL